MPRPKLHSDETILDAAKSVLKRCGPADFTLQCVAEEVGISRAALIQRFTNKENLLRCVMERGVVQTREHLDTIPVKQSMDGLFELLDELCKVMGAGERFETNLLIAWHETRDPELRRLSQARCALVHEAIAKRIPTSCPIPAAEAADLLHTVISGAAMQWVVSSEGRLDQYVQTRVRLAVSRLLKSSNDHT